MSYDDNAEGLEFFGGGGNWKCTTKNGYLNGSRFDVHINKFLEVEM